MKILVLNCGSSSIKYQLLEMGNEEDLLAKGLLDRIGIKDSELSHQPKGKDKFKLVQDVPDHTCGIDLILQALTDPNHGVLTDIHEIKACGHRVAHGGEYFSKSTLITEQGKIDIEKCCELAPLHNPANLKGILAMEKLLPGVPQVGVFDTSFHQTMPAHSFMYAIPYAYYDKYKVRRYGFHGTSHKYVAEKACDMLNKKMSDINIITCHLGNGASVTAIQKGKSVDSSMGFTPVEGLIMGTRAGDLDLGVLLFLMDKEGLDCQKANNLINKQSGMLGVSGVSMDMRDLHAAADSGNEKARLALDMYAYRVKKYIGAYAAAMGGVDLILFTGGIGENDFMVREWSCEGLEYMGVEFDKEANNGVKGKDLVISKPTSKVTVMTVSTNEELVIATDTKNIVAELK
ncbi:MAG: acetate kinase [Bacteroidetes bacterium HGW-Bacteroidetes-21]|jgi:acetate kinase|nr:MAG: acetate kinase [Bacteroidetes bacterium HGW-Bacteroidetes-21]